jgi:DNA-binding beta-propeller fold protein YncE
MKQLFILLILTSMLLAACQESLTPTLETSVQPNTPEPTITHTPIPTSTLEPTTTPTPSITPVPEPQGMGPYDMAITKDGEYAYVDMALPVSVFKVRLEDMVVEAVADLSEYFPSEGGSNIALDTSEKKLFVAADVQEKLLVIDTETMSVIQAIDNIRIIGMTISQYGPVLLTWGGGDSVKLVNTETYEVSEFVATGEFFLKIQESGDSQDLWYVVSGKGPGPVEVNVGIYDHTTKSWSSKISLPPEARADTVFDLEILGNEQKAYVAIFGGWYPDYHAYGWLHSVDMVSGEVKVVPIDGGAFHLESSPDNRWVYVGTGWPIPNTNNILVVDTQSDDVVDQIYLGKTLYGWHYTQMDGLQIDPAQPGLLYATNGDGNALVKTDLDNLIIVDVLVFNQERYQPQFFVRRPEQATGFILIRQSPHAFNLNLNKATIDGVVSFPNIRKEVDSYDIAIKDTGSLLIAQGEYFLEVDVEDMRLLGNHPLPLNTPSVWQFVLSNNQKMIYSITSGPEGHLDNFLAINTTNFQVEASVRLEGGDFNSRLYEVPDSSKLYALGGQQNGPVVVHVIDQDTHTIQKTITYEEPGMLGISAGPYYPFAFDSNSHTLFVGATQIVLAIDTETDEIEKVFYLGDVAKAIGLEPWQITYINAIGMVYNPQENYLYIAHLDYSFVSIYDLTNDQFLPTVIQLNGFFPRFMFPNDDYSKIYSLNSRSDNISVIDVNRKMEEKVIDLHSYLPNP